MTSLCRRNLLLAAGAAVTPAFLPAPVRAAQFEYKLAHSLPTVHPQHVRLTQLADEVEKTTGGRLAIKIFPDGQLGGQEAVLSQLRLGALQFLVIGDLVYNDIVPAAGISSVGFAFKDARSAWTAYNQPSLDDYLRKEFLSRGLYFPHGGHFDLGMRQMSSALRPIRSASDLVGLKIRIPPSKIATDLFRTLGASPVAISQNEVYTGLQTHVADAQEGPYLTFDSFKLYEVQKYMSVTNHMWTVNSLVANAGVWNALPPDVQTTLERAIGKYSQLEHEDAVRLNDSLAAKLQKDGMAFNTADTASMRSVLGPYYARWKAEFGAGLWGLLEAGVGPLR